MKKPNDPKLKSFTEHLDEEYGLPGTTTRIEYEEGFEVFKFGLVLQELRKQRGLTQEALAEKCGTTKTYISRIENNVSDMRLSTLMRIINQGFGGHLKLSVSL